VLARPLPSETHLPQHVEAPRRLIEIDRLKACAILAVVMTHAGVATLGKPFDPVDFWMRTSWTLFHVPAFLVATGVLLQQGTAMSWRTVVDRVQRIYVPYLVALGLIFACGWVPRPAWTALVPDLVLASSFGIYYFVPVFALCVLFAWGVSRLDTPARWGLLVLLVTYLVAQTIVPEVAFSQRLFWRVRDPLTEFWFGYVLLGMLGAVPIISRLPRWALVSAAVAALLVIYGATNRPFPSIRLELVRLWYTLAVLGLLWRLPMDFPGMRLLSEATLAIYLFQAALAQFVVVRWFAGWRELAAIPAVALVSLTLTLALIAAARRALGRERARFWLGA
jgi:peptidoglycan/LPS O-acetylase OafA/YrhL